MKRKSTLEEDYKILRTSLLSEWGEASPVCVLVTLPEGRPDLSLEIAKGLADSMKELELSALAVDANVFQSGEAESAPGLCEWLAGGKRPEPCDGIFPLGNPAVLSARQLLSLPDKLKQSGLPYQYYLVACPGCAEHADIAALAAGCDTTLLVVESGKTARKEALKAKENLVMTRADILGVIFVK